MTTDTKFSDTVIPTNVESPYFWTYKQNPLLCIIQVEPLSDIDEGLVASYREKYSNYRIVTVDKIPLLHLSNRYPRLSASEYLRSLLPTDVVAATQLSIDGNDRDSTNSENPPKIPDTMEDRYRLAYGKLKDSDYPMVESLLTLEDCLEREILDCKLGATISLTPGFLDTISARLYNTMATNFYANGDVTEAMAAQAIINYNLTPANTMMQKNHRKLCKIMAHRIVPYLSTKIPTLILLDSSHFNSFITGSCADRLITEHGAFINGSEMALSSTIEGIEAIYQTIGSDDNAMISLLARIWVIQSLIDVCDIEFAKDRLEICKINVVAKLLGKYIGHEDPEDAIDLFSFYTATSRNPIVSLKKHRWIVKNIADIYRKVGYNDRADYITRTADALKK